MKTSLNIHLIAKSKDLTIPEKLDQLFGLCPWRHTGSRSQRFDVSVCEDGKWLGAYYRFKEEELEGLDYDLFGPSWCSCSLNIVFYSKLPKSMACRNSDDSRTCMSREEVHEAGLDHPFVESIINESTEPISPKKMVSTRKT